MLLNLDQIHYHQGTDFTCGPCSLMMGLSVLKPGYEPNDLDEMLIWREANTVFMGSGHAGCSPYGLARAAMRRRLKAEIWQWNAKNLFSSWTRNPTHRLAMKTMMTHDQTRAEEEGAVIQEGRWDYRELRKALSVNRLALVLTSDGIEAHWMLAAIPAGQKDIVLVDPQPDETFDYQKIIRPTPRRFNQLISYGRENTRVAVLLSRRRGNSAGTAQK